MRTFVRHRLWLAMISLASLLCSHSGQAQQAVTLTSETDLIAILANANADPGEKALACKRLAIYGSPQSVPELSKLLADPRLASWARIALEAIPGDQPNVALRQAAKQLDDLLLIGVINSLGVRRDSMSVEILSTKMQQGSPEVASAAALALGRIGTDEASAKLLGFLDDAQPPLQSAVAEGCVYCAQRFLKEGNAQNAIEICDKIRSGSFPQQRIVEATRGAILARGDQGVELLVEQLRSPNRKLLAVGLQTARELSSDKLGPALMAEVSQATTDRAALIVEALGDLAGRADLKSLQTLASNGSKEVRLAAINVLGRIGDATCVDTLLSVGSQNDDLRPAVRAALVALSDPQVNAAILARLPNAKQDKQVLLEVIGLRQLEATDELVKAIDDNSEAVRVAALQALGQTVPQSRLDTLVGIVVKPKLPADATAAASALRTAAVRMPDREGCAALLSGAVERAPASVKPTLLEIIAAVGGTKALETVAQYARSKDDTLRDITSRLMGEWMTIDVAPVLLDLATKGPADRFQVRAMRGYIRVARQFVMPDEDRVKMCQQAMAAAKNVAEQKLILDVLKRDPSLGTLRLAIESHAKPALKEEARQCIEAIGKKLADNNEAQQLIKQAGL